MSESAEDQPEMTELEWDRHVWARLDVLWGELEVPKLMHAEFLRLPERQLDLLYKFVGNLILRGHVHPNAILSHPVQVVYGKVETLLSAHQTTDATHIGRFQASPNPDAIWRLCAGVLNKERFMRLAGTQWFLQAYLAAPELKRDTPQLHVVGVSNELLEAAMAAQPATT